MPRLPRSLLGLAALCAALFAPAAATATGAIVPLESFASKGEGAGQLRAPNGVAVAADGEVFVSDQDNNRIAVFSAGGRFLRAFGKGVGGPGADVCTSECVAAPPGETDAGAIEEPRELALGPEGVYVADQQLSRVDVFSAEGEFRFAFGKDVDPDGGNICDEASGCQKGSSDGSPGSFGRLEGIAVAPGAIYAADGEGDRVIIFSLRGEYLFSFNGGLDSPTDVAIGLDGNVYVSDAAGVAVFTPDGAPRGRFGDGPGPGWIENPVALAVGPDGRVHVADRETKVMSFDVAGAFLGSFAAPGANGIALDCRGALYVSDFTGGPGSDQIDRYGEPGTQLPPCPPVPLAPPSAAPGASIEYLPTNLFGIGKLERNLTKGTAWVRVRVPGPGRLVLRGPGVVKVVRTPAAAGGVRVTVRPKGKAKRRLRETGKATAAGTLIFTPTGGTPRAEPRAFVLRRNLDR